MSNFVNSYCEFPTALRRPMWKIWHKLLIRFDKDISANFMNYGYASLNGEASLRLKEEDEPNRYCIQLYDHLVNKVSLEGKKVVEVGSGRGGGAHFIARYYKPLQYTAMDISPSIIKFCNNYYNEPGLSFMVGRAEKLPFETNSCDAVVNVESARCYKSIQGFFNEVHRVLFDTGHFLFADMIEKDKVDTIRQQLINSGFKIDREINITPNVSRGLEMDTHRRENLIRKKVPFFLSKSFKTFAGTKGTKRYNDFIDGTFEYWSFVLSKA